MVVIMNEVYGRMAKLTAHVCSSNFPCIDDVESGSRYVVRDQVQTVRVKSSEEKKTTSNLPKVSKHHRGAKDHRGWVGSIGAHDV